MPVFWRRWNEKEKRPASAGNAGKPNYFQYSFACRSRYIWGFMVEWQKKPSGGQTDYPGNGGQLSREKAIKTGKEEEEFLAEGEISYFGKKYRYKNDLINILCMGVDRLRLNEGEAVYGEGGQADAIVLLSLHARSGAITLLHISRETLAEIELYTETGRYAGMESRQLCLAYSYGDGREKSCENVGRAVSRLL